MPLAPAAVRLAFAAVFAFAAAGFGYRAFGETGPDFTPPPAARGGYGDQRVVYHLAESGGLFGRRHRQRLANMENHRAATATGRLDLVVVMNGDGVDLLVAARGDADLARRIDALKAAGVRFLICRNTLIGRHLDWTRDLHGVAPDDIVDAGVAEIARLEGGGYAYLRP